MNLRSIFYIAAGAVLVGAAWQSFGGMGVAMVITGIATWMLLHVTRIMHVMKKAAQRPKGFVTSAVMFNARLKPKVNLLYVIGMTNSLGEQLTPLDEQPEIFRWTDASGSHVTCEFLAGKLVKWTLYRPPETDEAGNPPAP
jgi:hypothetical protein